MTEALRDGLFFDAAGARLYGFMHPALGPAKPVACVIVHPFMEERQDAHAVLRSLAVALAARGHATLRFDLYGCGDSEGDWRGASLARWCDDVAAAARASDWRGKVKARSRTRVAPRRARHGAPGGRAVCPLRRGEASGDSRRRAEP